MLRLLILPCLLVLCSVLSAQVTPKRVVLIAGNPSHGPGAHEHRAGCLLFQKCLASVPGLQVDVYDGGWPGRMENGTRVDHHAALENADAIVIYSDGGQKHPVLVGDRLEVLRRHVQRGVGLGLIHYAVEPTLERGNKEFIEWVGGAFEIHWSVNPHWDGEFKQLPEHPVTRGVQPFTTRDEWYFNMRFRPELRGITPILSAVPPPETMKRPDGPHSGNPAARAAVARGDRQHVMWVAERPGGGRGFGFTGGHFHAGWANDDQRKLVLNSILWIAGADVPRGGVYSQVTEAELRANLDVKPAPAPKKPKSP